MPSLIFYAFFTCLCPRGSGRLHIATDHVWDVCGGSLCMIVVLTVPCPFLILMLTVKTLGCITYHCACHSKYPIIRSIHLTKPNFFFLLYFAKLRSIMCLLSMLLIDIDQQKKIKKSKVFTSIIIRYVVVCVRLPHLSPTFGANEVK